MTAGIGVNDGALSVIERNDIHSNQVLGLGVKTSANPIVRSNKIRLNGSGIGISEDAKGEYSSNLILDNQKVGIAVKKGGDPKVFSNEIRGNKLYGIFVSAEGAGLFEENSISGKFN